MEVKGEAGARDRCGAALEGRAGTASLRMIVQSSLPPVKAVRQHGPRAHMRTMLPAYGPDRGDTLPVGQPRHAELQHAGGAWHAPYAALLRARRDHVLAGVLDRVAADPKRQLAVAAVGICC